MTPIRITAVAVDDERIDFSLSDGSCHLGTRQLVSASGCSVHGRTGGLLDQPVRHGGRVAVDRRAHRPLVDAPRARGTRSRRGWFRPGVGTSFSVGIVCQAQAADITKLGRRRGGFPQFLTAGFPKFP